MMPTAAPRRMSSLSVSVCRAMSGTRFLAENGYREDATAGGRVPPGDARAACGRRRDGLRRLARPLHRPLPPTILTCSPGDVSRSIGGEHGPSHRVVVLNHLDHWKISLSRTISAVARAATLLGEQHVR